MASADVTVCWVRQNEKSHSLTHHTQPSFVQRSVHLQNLMSNFRVGGERKQKTKHEAEVMA